MNHSIAKPLVSIITPTLNSEKYIRDNIKSILTQTYSNIEHIIIDGGSTDNTIAVIMEMDPNAVILSEPDEGISDAFNKGLRLAKGDIIAILNSDDYYADNQVIKKVVEMFTLKPEIMIIYGKVRFIDSDTEETLAIYYSEPFSLEKMKRELIIAHPSTFMRGKVYKEVGEFSLLYRICMDHDYLLRAVKKYYPLAVDDIFTVMRRGGISTKSIYLAHREAYRIFRSNGGSIAMASMNLVSGYMQTWLSLTLQDIGLSKMVLFYRKQMGRL